MAPRTIALSAPDIGPEERELVDRVLRSGTLAGGAMVASFEREFAERFQARHAVAMSSGTAALHVAMLAAGVGEGDQVITSPFSFVASANSILFERGTPVFVDIDPVTLCMDSAATVAAIERLAPAGRLRAILPVHIFGRTVEMTAIVTAAREHGIPVIEDACEAIGASADGISAGQWGDAAVFGFYPNKQMTTGEGGMLLTDRDDWARLARSLRNQGRSEDGSWLQHERLGYNYRLDEMSAAVGLAQLRRLDELLRKRQSVADRYNELLRGSDIRPLAPPRNGMSLSWFTYVVRLPQRIARQELMKMLAGRGIATRAYFPPIHLLPFYRERFGFAPGMFPHTEAAGETWLALPFHGGLADDDIEYVCEVLLASTGITRLLT